MQSVNLAPAEGDSPRSISALLHQRLVELPARAGVDLSPAMLAVVLQAGHVGAEERCELATAARSLALITHLVVQNIRLHLHLKYQRNSVKPGMVVDLWLSLFRKI